MIIALVARQPPGTVDAARHDYFINITPQGSKDSLTGPNAVRGPGSSASVAFPRTYAIIPPHPWTWESQHVSSTLGSRKGHIKADIDLRTSVS
ncbi:hypothetical protein ANO14919_034360 [Xylariales sp. No.14919]|nr:hypothetical protein ANO14919_034360 [Xylariales sp. No.14919]